MSAHHTSPLRPHGEDLLRAALSDPFSVPPDIPRISPVSPSQPAPSDTHTPPEPATSDTPEPSLSSSSTSAAEQDAWKVEYEAQVVEWRRQSADVRARAEVERARWEERRAREREEQALRRPEVPRAETSVSVDSASASTSTSEWEAVSVATQPGVSVLAPNTTAPDPRGRSGAPSSHSQEPRTRQNLPQSTSSNVPPTRPAPSDSPQWENMLSSPTSSFPSMSFPEPSQPHSPDHSLHASRAATTPAPRPATTASATLAVFDPTLPASARIWALCSSLSINMFLPFVNGVMLGFGEIFAKTVIVGWLGWGPAVATNVGLGVFSRNRSQNK